MNLATVIGGLAQLLAVGAPLLVQAISGAKTPEQVHQELVAAMAAYHAQVAGIDAQLAVDDAAADAEEAKLPGDPAPATSPAVPAVPAASR